MLVVRNVENDKFVKFGRIINNIEKWYYTTDKNKAKRFKTEAEADAYCSRFDETFFWDRCVTEKI